jgi:endonuclease YncB( thermonuclease family)
LAFFRLVLVLAVAMTVTTPVCAEVVRPPVFDVPQVGVAFATGDTWTQNGQAFRLYGVQSCIRGTTFTNPVGAKSDCGEASIAYLAAVIRDTRPRCAPVAQIGKEAAILVVCSAHVGSSTLDNRRIRLRRVQYRSKASLYALHRSRKSRQEKPGRALGGG